ncbi:hypothetical protein ATZ33_09005 [Enterococcus silesiacus]|uniref:PadR family transcriptional regulator n=1 Tax=Enterococcus silesiacus TaxID=332949 RepID=A0A0S3KB68_9ENTE|nr:PadR family transcriptional regulator [Enterococcus silesiacus]ALS01500.1 hypothetical protein ATZ33_09005 [Enterococcus silesiacus]OJG91928.1 hypothetical protein RV15_GL003573 [Enterococcus silesiacus]
MEDIILGCLAVHPMNGYGLKQFIAGSVNTFSDVSFGTLYPALKRLQDKELILLKIENGKKIYYITKKGEETLEEWLMNKQSKFKMNYEFLTKLFFSGLIETEKVKENILAHLKEIEQEKIIMEKTLIDFEPHVDIYQKMTIKFAIDFYDFLANWYTDFLNELDLEGK